MRLAIQAPLLAALLGLFAASADAVFIPVADARGISSDYVSFCPGCGPEGEDVYYSDPRSDAPAFPFAPFDASVESGSTWFASQTSLAGATALTGTGSAGTFTGEEGGASSLYDITFDVDVPTAVTLSGVLDGQSFTGYLHFTLYEGASVLYEQDASGTFASAPLDFAGVLDPGQFRVLVEASFSGGLINDEVAYDFALQQVPEPSTLGLLAVGLVALARVRRVHGPLSRQKDV